MAVLFFYQPNVFLPAGWKKTVHLLHRWRAELSCALVLGDTEVFLGAVQGTPPAGGEPARAEVQLYDLQSMRVAY